MKILITGGTGSLAEYVVKELERDHELVLFDRVRPGEGRIAFVGDHEYVQGDLTDGGDCARAVWGCDAVVHLAAIPYPTDHRSSHTASLQAMGIMPRGMPFDETMRVNTMGTYHILHAAVEAKVGVVVAVTSNALLGHLDIYRISDNPFPIHCLPIDEEHPIYPEGSYALSKSFQEQLLEMYSRAHGIRAYALRPARIQRPEIQREHARRVQPTKAFTGEVVNGYTDIEDAARAVRMCLDAHRDLPAYDAYYVNAADTLSLEDSGELVERFRPDLLDSVRDLPGRAAFISSAKATRAFGWRPAHSWTRFLPGQAG